MRLSTIPRTFSCASSNESAPSMFLGPTPDTHVRQSVTRSRGCTYASRSTMPYKLTSETRATADRSLFPTPTNSQSMATYFPAASLRGSASSTLWRAVRDTTSSFEPGGVFHNAYAKGPSRCVHSTATCVTSWRFLSRFGLRTLLGAFILPRAWHRASPSSGKETCGECGAPHRISSRGTRGTARGAIWAGSHL